MLVLSELELSDVVLELSDVVLELEESDVELPELSSVVSESEEPVAGIATV